MQLATEILPILPHLLFFIFKFAFSLHRIVLEEEVLFTNMHSDLTEVTPGTDKEEVGINFSLSIKLSQ